VEAAGTSGTEEGAGTWGSWGALGTIHGEGSGAISSFFFRRAKTSAIAMARSAVSAATWAAQRKR
jgi:hypothetical protein